MRDKHCWLVAAEQNPCKSKYKLHTTQRRAKEMDSKFQMLTSWAQRTRPGPPARPWSEENTYSYLQTIFHLKKYQDTSTLLFKYFILEPPPPGGRKQEKKRKNRSSPSPRVLFLSFQPPLLARDLGRRRFPPVHTSRSRLNRAATAAA